MNANIFLVVCLIVSLLASYLRLLPNELLLMIIGIIATVPVFIHAVEAIGKRKISVDLLASIALIVSIIHEEWSSVAFINLMITSARIFGDYTEGKARSSIKSLLKLRPEKVKVKEHKEFIVKAIDRVQLGDIVVIESGERVPIDGRIIEGQGTIDQSSLTGESLPIEKKEGEMVLSSTLVTSGSFLVRTEKIGKDTTFEKIVNLVENAQSGKAGIQTIADRFASWYIVITIVGALTLYAVTHDMNIVLSVLLVTCADDIAVAVPMAFWAAIAFAAKRGIIVKGGNYLEGMSHVSILLADKTGTLTKGRIAVRHVYAFGSYTQERVLRLASYVACVSEHPLSKAITERALADKIHEDPPEKFREYPGKGIASTNVGKHILLGNARFLEEMKIPLSYEQIQLANKMSALGDTAVFLGYEGKCIGLFALADEPRVGIRQTMEKLHTLGVQEIIMLTGDNERVARHVMDETGVTAFHANLLPEEKVTFVKKHLQGNTKLAFVGDGVNDAAALAISDIGIAMGAIGSDAAIESADIALMHDDFTRIPEIISIGRHVMRVAKQNFIIWGVVNSIGLFLVFVKVIGPTEAAAFNFITDFFPLLNSMRLFRRQSFDRVIG